MADAGATQPSVLTADVRAACRHYEPDRYIAALLAPRPVRNDLIAIAAFSSELLRVGDTVREPMIGQIRLQWWYDTLEALARGDNSGHPVADAAGDAMRRHQLPPELLGSLIEARMSDLETGPPAGAAVLKDYLVQSEGALIRLALRILGVEITPQIDATADQAAIAYGMARMLVRLPRALRRFGRRGPAVHRLEAAGLGEGLDEEGLRLTPALAGVLADFRQEARDALGAMRQSADRLGPRAFTAFLPLVMVEPYLRAQEQVGFDPLSDLVEVAPLRRVWRIWRAHRRKRL